MFLSMKTLPKSALITGSSRGLGAALARRLAALGTRVVLVARHPEPLREVVAGIRARGGVAHALTFDVADKHAVYPIAASAAELVGPIDLLIHNASELGPTPLRPLLDTACEDFERVLAVNLLGPFRLTKAVAGAMALRKRGTIVHLSSDAAVNAYANWGIYSVSKAALDHLTRTLSVELSPQGVRVFSVDPGDMDTDMHRAAVPDADVSQLADPDAVAARIVSMITSPQVHGGQRLEVSRWQESF